MTQPHTLEEKLLRLKDIQTTLQDKSTGLQASIQLLEEAYALKKDIEKELQTMENKLTELARESEEEEK